jgi:hypothetical protein
LEQKQNETKQQQNIKQKKKKQQNPKGKKSPISFSFFREILA